MCHYDYVCLECGEEFEFNQDLENMRCPECHDILVPKEELEHA